MNTLAFLHDLAIIMLTAGVVTVVFHLLRQPVVLGYIVAGALIGPHTHWYASLITDKDTIHTLSELCVIFLLFSLGLEFSLRRLRQVGVPALLAALAEIVLMIWIGYLIGSYFQWGTMNSVFLGAMLAVSSTTIIVKALGDLKLKRERFAQLVFGVLIIEDILAIGMIALLSGIAKTGAVEAGQVLHTLGGLTIFIVVSLVLGILAVPRLLDYVARVGSNETLLVCVLGLLFGFCLIVIELGYSVALGAFLIGAVIAEARPLKRIEHLIEPVRDMFSAIFFVAIGLMFDPAVIVQYAGPIALITVFVVLGKLVSCGAGSYLAGQDARTSMRAGMSLAQIGEFSFIIASLGVNLKVTSDFLYPVAVAVSAVTTLLTPYLIRASDPVTAAVRRAMPSRIARIFQLYTEWLRHLRFAGESAAVAAMIRKILLQVFVNACMVAAIFGGGAYLAGSHALDDLSIWLPTPAIEHTAIWSAALLLSMPFLIAAYRKLKALAMLLAEISVPGTGRASARVRRVLAEVIPAVSVAGMLLLVCALSSSILPPAELLTAVLLMGAIVLALLWRTLVRLHSRLQIALIETMRAEKDAD